MSLVHKIKRKKGDKSMPLIRVDVYEGSYSEKELKNILDLIHKNAVESFKIPERDRYQIVSRHTKDEMILQDTGLGFERTDKAISIQIFSRPRDKQGKLDFYRNVTQELTESLGIGGEDILISLLENGDSDWSFGFGKAQFETGEL